MRRLGPPRGFAIVSAIFILVVLAALGAFILTVFGHQQVGSALDVQGVRAYQAARAGVEWGLYRVQATSIDPNSRTCIGGGNSSTTSFVPVAATLSGFVVTVTCEYFPPPVPPDPNNSPRQFVVQSTACNEPVAGWTATTVACPNTTGPGAFYVERRVSVSF